MNLSEPFIRRPVMTTLMTLLVVVAGLLCYELLPVSNLPSVDYPTITVSAVLPGASPETMANTVAAPLEKSFMDIPGLIDISSSNTLGTTSIFLQFDISRNIDAAAQDVNTAISETISTLPPSMPRSPIYKKVNPAETPILYLAVLSDTLDLGDIYTSAGTFIGQRLSMVNGVSHVTVHGFPKAVRIQIDPGLVASQGMTWKELASSVGQANSSIPTGTFNGAVNSWTVVTDGELQTSEAYNDLVVSYRNGAPVRIDDIGRAVDSLQNDLFSLKYWRDGKYQNGVVIAVERQPAANTIKVAEAIGKLLEELKPQLPGAIDLKVVFDKSESIKDSISHVKLTLLIAFILVVAVIFIYLGKIVDTIIPSVAIPLSICGTFIAMYALNFTIDNLSLLALILATGFIVDDAIVVLENIVRRIEGGETPWKASLHGSKQISTTIVSMTISLMAAFIPMLFMPGLIGKIFNEFAVTLAVVVLISGVISLTLTPMMCSIFLLPRKLIHAGGLASVTFHVNEKMLRLYDTGLKWVFNHRKFTVFIAFLSLVGSGYLFYAMPKDFLPEDDIGFVMAFTQAEEGTSFEKMSEYQEGVNKVFAAEPAIDSFVTLVGMGGTRKGMVFCKLVPASERESSTNMIQGMYKKLWTVLGVRTFLKNIPLISLEVGQGGSGAYQYALQSLKTEDLYAGTHALMDKMKSSPNFQAVNSDLEIKNPEVHVKILRDQAAALGINATDIEEALLLALAGQRVTKIQTPLDQYDVILELANKNTASADIFSSLALRSATTGSLVPMSAVVAVTDGVGAASINHISQFPSVTISFSIAPGIPLGTALAEIKEMAKESLAPTVIGEVKGSAQSFEQSMAGMWILFLAAVFVIYIVLGILYESFIHPLTILSALPPAAFGGLLTLYLFGYPLSLYGYLGVLLLIGIVKKNGIMMIDYAIENQREKNEPPKQAIHDACLVRFRPIMMTTLAAIMGALPIALGVGEGTLGLRPLGLVIIGGLVFSQLITLFLTPIIYLYFENLRTPKAKTK